jgi:AcrR family transcriptional regulator
MSTPTRLDRGGAPPRRRGRPPKTIDPVELADAASTLFAQGGIDAVTIERTARELGVSRATLYRSVPTKEHLLGLLYDRMADELMSAAVAAAHPDGRTSRERLHALMRVHIERAVRLRHYLLVFTGSGWLPEGALDGWSERRTDYAKLWFDTVAAAIEDGAIRARDPAVATNLILGMCIWVTRWYRPDQGSSADHIVAVAVGLLESKRAAAEVNDG